MTQTKDPLASLSSLRGHLLLTIGVALAVVLGIALTVRPAFAAASPTAPQAQMAEPEEEEEDWGNWEDWEETCEEEECKEEAWEEVPGEDEGGWGQVYDEEAEEKPKGVPTPGPSSECPLGTVKPKAIFERDRGKLRLVLRYTTDSPTQVGIDFWLRGGKGAMNGHGSARRQLNRNGVLRLGRHVDTQAQDEMRTARVVIVQLKAPQAPPSCPSQMTKRLAVGHDAGHVASAERPARNQG